MAEVLAAVELMPSVEVAVVVALVCTLILDFADVLVD